MKDPVAKPTTIELPLKPRDRSTACPDETRCQLEVIWDDGRGALTVHDGPRESKLVQVGLIGEKGCDAKVRVGMIEAGGPIAVGAKEIPGEIASTYEIWERRLSGCVDPDQIFFGKFPVHLLCGRYVDGREYTILVVCQDVSGNWHVIVDRRGVVETVPLIRDFAESDGLTVSAALSVDLLHLYIVVSRYSGGGVNATWYHYTYNRYSGDWHIYSSGTVPKPSDILSPRPYSVDRYGNISGYWATEETFTTVRDTEPEGAWCTNSGEGHDYRTTIRDYSAIYGGTWSILTQTYTPGNTRWRGTAIDGCGFAVVKEVFAPSNNHMLAKNNYEWATDGTAGWHTTRHQEYAFDSGQGFSVTIDGRHITSSNDMGLYRLFSGSADYLAYAIDEEFITHCAMDITFTFGGYTYFDGVKTIGVSPGGWITKEESGTTRIVSSMASELQNVPYFVCNNVVFPCPDLMEWFKNNRTTEEDIHTKEIIYPKMIGSYHSIGRSFSSFDEETGVTYYGIMLQRTEISAPAWYVYRNGEDITAAVASCLGRPMSELAAIYWRA